MPAGQSCLYDGIADANATTRTSNGWHRLCVVLAGLCALAILFRAGVAHALGEPRSIGVSKLVVRIDGDDTLGVAKADFRVNILEELRNQGFAAVDVEGLGAGDDGGKPAELLLGGIVRGVECRTLLQKGGACRLAIEWELRDVRGDVAVYHALTRAAVYGVDLWKPAGVGLHLVLGALRSLSQRPAFRNQLLRTPESTREGASVAATAVVDFADPVPSLDPELDARKAREATAQRAREEAALQERMASAARESREKEQRERIDALTPGYVKVMKWGGLGLAAAGAIAAVATYTAFDEKKTKEAEYDRLRLGNDLGWVAMGLGAASFGLSFALRPSLRQEKSALQQDLAVDLRPGQLRVRWCF
ncbi:MAG: hypothetical protein WDO69_32420 [Pseudomonadota bacterium]